MHRPHETKGQADGREAGCAAGVVLVGGTREYARYRAVGEGYEAGRPGAWEGRHTGYAVKAWLPDPR